MKVKLKKDILFCTATAEELTKTKLDEMNNAKLAQLLDKLAKVLQNKQSFNKLLLLVPFSSTNLQLYAILFNCETKQLTFQKLVNKNTNVKKPLSIQLNSTQEERKNFIEQFLGKIHAVNTHYNKRAYLDNDKLKLIQAREVEDNDNLNQYTCFPCTIYQLNLDSFHAKTTGKLYRKLSGIALDYLGQPFSIGKFGLDETEFKNYQKVNQWERVLLFGSIKKDTFNNRNQMFLEVDGMYAANQTFNDNSSNTSRIELSTHTKFSQMNAQADSNEIWQAAAQKGLHGLALTDGTSAQAYSNAMKDYPKFKHLKVLYGTEMNGVINRPNFVFNPNQIDLYDDDTTFVAFDIETTGLSTIHDDIIQLSAIRYAKRITTKMKGKGKNRHEEKHFTYDVIDSYDHIINIHKQIPEFVSKLTHITQSQINQASLNEKEALQGFFNFINEYEDTVLIGHNVVFDYNFINNKAKINHLKPIANETIDTLPIARRIVPNVKSYNLGKLTTKLGIKLDNAHNSKFDATATGYLLFALLQILRYGTITDLVNPKITDENRKYQPADLKIVNGNNLRAFETHGNNIYKESFPQTVNLIAKDQQGIKDLYQLISIAHVNHFYFEPRIYENEILKLRNQGHHFLYGSGTIKSRLFDTVTRYGYQSALKLVQAQQYDYLELVPISSLNWNIKDKAIQLKYQDYVNIMIKLSKTTHTILAVSSDVKYVLKYDKQAYDIIKGIDYQNDFSDLSLHSADELKQILKPFIPDKKILDDLVVQNTLMIANQIQDNLTPIKQKLTPPRIKGADEELRESAWNKAKLLYGQNGTEILPTIQHRIQHELDTVINNGYAVIYLTAKKLVDRSVKNGYLVGSRGSVGGSVVAYLVGITEVNALPPHYRSKFGDYCEFVDADKYPDGFNLPPKEDPNHPGNYLIGDGHNCSFEIFTGVSGKKVPDIDLNFASDIQNDAQLWLKDIFGQKNCLKVGTVQPLAQKTAFGKVYSYQRKYKAKFSKIQIQYLADKLVGVKKSSGQHPAGVLIIPEGKDIIDFTPYTWPANKVGGDWITSMFDQNMMHDSLLKMDCLANKDQSVQYFLGKTTGFNPKNITQLQIREVVQQIFAHYDRLLGTPEFGTVFSTNAVKEAQPKTYSDLVQISGLSHGTNVWAGNAEQLIQEGKANIRQVISTRDKILNDLIARGYPVNDAHHVIQVIKKKTLHLTEAEKQAIGKLGLPQWYLPSLAKITYLFPAAHAAAYVYSACRIGFYKLHFPLQFYASWLSYYQDGLEIKDVLANNHATLKNAVEKIEIKNQNKRMSSKDKTALTSLKIINEALDCEKRGYGKEVSIKFVKPSLNYSHATHWIPDNEKGIIYLSFEMLPEVSETMGEGLMQYRNTHETMSKHSQDYKDAGIRLSKKAVQSLIDWKLLID